MRAINKDKLLGFRYAPMPEIVRVSPVLSPGAKILYNQIISYFWQKDDEVAWPGQKKLAEKLSISDREVRKRLDELKEVELIAIKQRGLGQTNNIYLIEPKEKPLHVIKNKSGGYDPDPNYHNPPQLTQGGVENPPTQGGESITPVMTTPSTLTTPSTSHPVKEKRKPSSFGTTPSPKRSKEELLIALTELDKKAAEVSPSGRLAIEGVVRSDASHLALTPPTESVVNETHRTQALTPRKEG